MTEAFVDVPGGRVWTQAVGTEDGIALVALHGGPGWPSDSLEPIGQLANGRLVVFYDQLGCGRSDRPDDVALWRVDRFVEELMAVLDAWELQRAHLLGHSWGTILALESWLARADRVAALVLSSPVLSMPRYAADVALLLEDLPRFGEERDAAWGRRHFCRLDPHPDAMQRAGAAFGEQVYAVMNGSSEYQPDGTLSGYDVTAALSGVTAPTLLTCGRHDPCTPSATLDYAAAMPNAEVVVFENSSHVAFFEETDRYLAVVREFLHRADSSTRRD